MVKGFQKLFSSLLILALAIALMPAQSSSAATSGLFFSEYIEGSSFNKAVEIYNGTGASVDLSTPLEYAMEICSWRMMQPGQLLQATS